MPTFYLPPLGTYLRIEEEIPQTPTGGEFTYWTQIRGNDSNGKWDTFSWDLLPGETFKIKRYRRPTLRDISRGHPELWVQIALEPRGRGRQWVREKLDRAGFKPSSWAFWVRSDALLDKASCHPQDPGNTRAQANLDISAQRLKERADRLAAKAEKERRQAEERARRAAMTNEERRMSAIMNDGWTEDSPDNS